MRPAQIRLIPEVNPRDVPGFAEAMTTGDSPTVPSHAPVLLPGPSAQNLFYRLLARVGVAAAGIMITLSVFDHVPVVHAWTAVALFVLGLAWMVFFWAEWVQVGRRSFEEFERGYATFTMVFGVFTLHGPRRWDYGGDFRVPWNYSGAWVLDGRSGAVRSSPDVRVVAPGFYPSPTRPGMLELWTGATWAAQYRSRASR